MRAGKNTLRAPMALCCALMGLCGATLTNAAPWLRHTIDNSFLGADGARAEVGLFHAQPEYAVVWEQSGLTTLHASPVGGDLATCTWPMEVVGVTPNAEDAVAVDLDGDGDRDVIVCMEGPQRRVAAFINKEETFEEFPFQLDPYKWMIAEPSDLDHDGRVDVIVGGRFVQTNTQGQLAWLRPGSAAGAIAEWTTEVISDVGWPMALLTMDIDGDGDDDIVVADRYGSARGLHWLRNPYPENTSAPWTRFQIGLTQRRVKGVASADLDGDGGIDFVATYEGAGSQPAGLVTLRQGPGGWTEASVPLPAGVGEPKNVVIADMDLDGTPDIALSCEGAYDDLTGVCVLLQRAGGQWAPMDIAGPEGCKFDVITAVDVDGDGDTDIITTEEGDNGDYEALGVVWYENPVIGPPPGVDSLLALWPGLCGQVPEPILIELSRRLRNRPITPPSPR